MKLAEFAAWVIRDGAWGGTIDEMDILKKAVEFGVCEIVPYNRAVHGDSEFSEYMEDGDDYYVFTDDFKTELKEPNG